MELPISCKGFEGRRLTVQTGGIFSGPKLLLDGETPAKKKGSFILRDNYGKEVQARLKSRMLDPVPSVELGGESVALARPLLWYEYAWMGIPVLLVFVGGALGGLIGASAAYTSARVFRGEAGALTKYLLTGAISLVAVVAYLVAALVLQIVIRG